jgi:hypothetical protein
MTSRTTGAGSVMGISADRTPDGPVLVVARRFREMNPTRAT